MMTRSFATPLFTLALLANAACGGAQNELAGALPSDDAVQVRVPGAARAQGQSAATQGLVGETSDFYVHTYRISRVLNGHVIALLGQIRQWVSNPPTSHEGNKSVWGPYTPGGLEPLTYRLTAEKTAEHTFALVLQARPKAQADEAAFKTLLEGTVVGSGQEDGRGRGDLALHFDNARAINPGVVERGDILVHFDALVEPRLVTIAFDQFGGEDGVPHDASYRYEEAQDRSGMFLFAIAGNVHKADENKPGLEQMTLRSRWDATGAGRGDVTVTGDEVSAQLQSAGLSETSVKATECWGDDFTVVFQDTLPEALREHIRPLQGDAAQCAVPEASFPDPNL